MNENLTLGLITCNGVFLKKNRIIKRNFKCTFFFFLFTFSYDACVLPWPFNFQIFVVKLKLYLTFYSYISLETHLKYFLTLKAFQAKQIF